LAEHYGISDAGAAYFALHEERDVEHAATARTLIAERLDGADPVELLAQADRVLAANWRLLDGAERLAA
jgi:pyrroloquinoline quinone (PQQ) biosynthesis protein C